MTPARHDWLPLSALEHISVTAPLAAAVAAWSQHWFARRRLAAVELAGVGQARREPADGGGWRGYGNGLAISCARRAAARLAGWALDADLETLAPAGLDRRVVEAFEAQVMADLVARVSTAAGLAAPDGDPAPVSAPFDEAGGLLIGLSDQGAAWFWLALPAAAALALRRRALPAPRAAAPPLVDRWSAAASTPIRLEACLADVEMSLCDLTTLSAGDVLVLDQSADSPAELRLACGGPVMRGLLTAADGRTALLLQAS